MHRFANRRAQCIEARNVSGDTEAAMGDDSTTDVRHVLPVTRPIVGDVAVPASKSEMNRALICAALADGVTTLHDIVDCEDTDVLATALARLGITVERDAALDERVSRPLPHDRPETWRIHGGRYRLRPPADPAPLMMRNAGTATRFLTALLPLVPGSATIDGEPRMRERPILPLVEALRQAGAQLDLPAGTGCPPIASTGPGQLRGGRITLDASASSQYLSAMLLTGPYHDEPLELLVRGAATSRPYVAMTRRTMARFGVEVEVDGAMRVYRVPRANYRATDMAIEADASAAVYPAAMAAIGPPGSRIRITNLRHDTAQADARLLDVLAQMGAVVTFDTKQSRRDASGPVDGVGVTIEAPANGRLTAPRTPIDMEDWPDAAPTLAVVAAFAAGTTTLTGLGNLKIKECDRYTLTAANLSALGVHVDTNATGDRLTIRGDPNRGLQPTPTPVTPRTPSRESAASLETALDHRMVMAFAVAGLRLPGGAWLPDPTCVGKSYPGFWEMLATLTANASAQH